MIVNPWENPKYPDTWIGISGFGDYFNYPISGYMDSWIFQIMQYSNTWIYQLFCIVGIRISMWLAKKTCIQQVSEYPTIRIPHFYLQLPITSGHDCQSMGKLRSIMGHLALIVSLKMSRTTMYNLMAYIQEGHL